MHAAPVAPHAPPARADNAAALRQIAESMTRFTDGSVDIRLNPEELGRVRLQMVPGEAGLMVHVQADRPETLDLLRRHIDQLARDLAAAGHDAAGFTFGRDGNGAKGSDRIRDENQDAVIASALPHSPDAPPADRYTATQDGSIDIRL